MNNVLERLRDHLGKLPVVTSVADWVGDLRVDIADTDERSYLGIAAIDENHGRRPWNWVDDPRVVRIKITGHSMRRGAYGWNDCTRMFKVKPDGSYNSDSLIAAINEMAGEMVRASWVRVLNKASDAKEAEARFQYDAQMLERLGTDWRDHAYSTASGINIDLRDLDVDTAVRVLQLVGKA